MATESSSVPSTSKTLSIVVTYRGQSMDFTMYSGMTVATVKMLVAQYVQTKRYSNHQDELDSINLSKLQPSDLKLMYKGKILKDDRQQIQSLFDIVSHSMSRKQGLTTTANNVLKLVAMGVPKDQAETWKEEFKHGIRQAERNVRDDLSKQGQAHEQDRKRLGRRTLQEAARKTQTSSTLHTIMTGQYGFGSIQTLPNLPDQEKAHEILSMLANDPGIVACMTKHQWKVGSLAELYPEGKVGESDVCLMGLNQNAGGRILLRIRTDDLKGFRKILSIRQVLYHELAHNVHSDHDGAFFKLMRQIEKECTSMDWTKGAGLSSSSSSSDALGMESFQGGTFRLGHSNDINTEAATGTTTTTTTSPLQGPNQAVTAREMAARAALQRHGMSTASTNQLGSIQNNDQNQRFCGQCQSAEEEASTHSNSSTPNQKPTA